LVYTKYLLKIISEFCRNIFSKGEFMNWLDKSEYPFQSKWFTSEYGKVHYIDEGTGEIILFVHGTPTWSFLYRNIIKELSKSYRCIAIDNLGFGLSEKPINFEGTPQAHNQILDKLISQLHLKNINLVVHDFGGTIGIPYAINNPENINKIIFFNTWLWETKNSKDVQKVDKILNSPIGKFLYLYLNFSPKILFKKAFYDKSKLSKNIHKQYISPFPNKNSRLGLLKIGKSLLGSSDWYESYWSKIEIIVNKKTLFLWSEKDEFIKPEFLEKWLTKFKSAKVKKYDTGHFPQEECFAEIIVDLKEFLKE
jgi:haloalkane dehalogenase